VVDLFSSSVDPTLLLESDTKAVYMFPPVNPILPLENKTQVVDLVLSSVDPTPPLTSAKVVDPVPSLVSPTLHPKSAKVVDPVPSSVNPILHLKSAKVVDPVPSSVSPTLHLKSAKVVDPVPSSGSPILHPKSTKVVYPGPPIVDPIQSSGDPTLLLESKPDTAHVFLVNTHSTMPGGIPPSPLKPLPSTEAILFDWGVLTGPHLPSHIPFQITVQVYGRDVPQTLIDEGASVSIFSSIALYALGCLQIALVTQNLLSFNRRTSQPLGILPQFPVTLGGKTVFIDVMVV
jgi:hypothetical protein